MFALLPPLTTPPFTAPPTGGASGGSTTASASSCPKSRAIPSADVECFSGGLGSVPANQGLPLVRFSSQPQPFLSLRTSETNQRLVTETY